MNAPDDARLESDFKSLREEDGRTAPDFLDTFASAAARHRRRSRLWFFVAVAATAAVIAILIARPGAPRPREKGSLLTWSSPTAFLLETPGTKLWKEVPRFPDAQRGKERR